jgi:hypothetical protein
MKHNLLLRDFFTKWPEKQISQFFSQVTLDEVQFLLKNCEENLVISYLIEFGVPEKHWLNSFHFRNEDNYNLIAVFNEIFYFRHYNISKECAARLLQLLSSYEGELEISSLLKLKCCLKLRDLSLPEEAIICWMEENDIKNHLDEREQSLSHLCIYLALKFRRAAIAKHFLSSNSVAKKYYILKFVHPFQTKVFDEELRFGVELSLEMKRTYDIFILVFRSFSDFCKISEFKMTPLDFNPYMTALFFDMYPVIDCEETKGGIKIHNRLLSEVKLKKVTPYLDFPEYLPKTVTFEIPSEKLPHLLRFINTENAEIIRFLLDSVNFVDYYGLFENRIAFSVIKAIRKSDVISAKFSTWNATSFVWAFSCIDVAGIFDGPVETWKGIILIDNFDGIQRLKTDEQFKRLLVLSQSTPFEIYEKLFAHASTESNQFLNYYRFLSFWIRSEYWESLARIRHDIILKILWAEFRDKVNLINELRARLEPQDLQLQDAQLVMHV